MLPMKIEIRQVIAVLRSFNAPSEVISYFTRLEPQTVGTCEDAIMKHALHLAGENTYVRKSDLMRRVLALSIFRNAPNGPSRAFEDAINALMANDKIRKADLDEGKAALNTTGVVYQVIV